LTMLVTAGCGGGSGCSHNCAAGNGSASTTAPALENRPAYARPGPYVVAIATIEADREIDVFYPAPKGSAKGVGRATFDIRQASHDPDGVPLKPDSSQLQDLPAYRDLKPAPGRFPVVLFSHDYGASPLQNATLESDIAAWGFIVIAPDEVARDTLALIKGTATVNDARDARDLERALGAVASDPSLSHSLNIAHVAAVGDGQGGATALAALSMPNVDGAVAWASVAPTGAVAPKPVMLIGAARDIAYGSTVQREILGHLAGPRRLVLLGGGAGHATFVDECEQLRDTGELIPGNDKLNSLENAGDRVLALAQNGCFSNEIEPSLVWPVIAHFTVAELRSVFGIDPSPVGLGERIAAAFPNVPLTYEQHS
jgi:predicted dienelactone hydrolase